MLPQKIFKIRIFNLADNKFQTIKFPDFPLTVGIQLHIPCLFGQISRFSRSVTVTLYKQKTVKL